MNGSAVFFEKGNYILRAFKSEVGPVIEIIARDPIKEDSWVPDPKHFRIVLPCPTKEILELIGNLLPNIKT